MADWVISIGCGKSQIPLIQEAKTMGFNVLSFDQSSESNLVDCLVKQSTFDSYSCLEEIKIHHNSKDFRAVISRVSGLAVLTAAKIANFLNLPHSSLRVAKASASKFQLSAISKKIGIRTIPSINPANINFGSQSVVVKPDQPVVGKKNVYRVKTLDELTKASKLAGKESVNGNILIQEYITGRDIGLMLACKTGVIKWSFFYEEMVIEKDGSFLGKGVAGPITEFPKKLIDILFHTAQKFLYKTRANGFVFFSFRVTSSHDYYLYEVNPGLCGDGIVDNLLKKLMPNINFYEADLMLALGKEINLPDTRNLKKLSIINPCK